MREAAIFRTSFLNHISRPGDKHLLCEAPSEPFRQEASVPWLFFPEANGVELRMIQLRERPLRKTEGDREATLRMFYC